MVMGRGMPRNAEECRGIFPPIPGHLLPLKYFVSPVLFFQLFSPPNKMSWKQTPAVASYIIYINTHYREAWLAMGAVTATISHNCNYSNNGFGYIPIILDYNTWCEYTKSMILIHMTYLIDK
jgi:hypothetical protein